MAKKYYFASYAKHHKNIALNEMAAEFHSVVIHQYHPIRFIERCNKLPGDQRYVLISWQDQLARDAREFRQGVLQKTIKSNDKIYRGIT